MTDFVCVTGMHRSGTSLVSRLLNLLGVDLGPEEGLIEPRPENPKGFWENVDITTLNDQVLTALGGAWHTPPPLGPGWEHRPELDDLYSQAKELLDRCFPDAELAGWKDPRTSLLLPFWRKIAHVRGTVLVIRDPREVMTSLKTRNGLPADRAAALYTRYVTSAAAHDPDHVLLTYDGVLEDVDGAVDLLVSKLGLPQPTEEAREAVRRFADPSLRRSRPDGEDLAGAPALALSLYELLAAGDRRTYQPIVAELHALQSSTGELETLRHQLRQLGIRIEQAGQLLRDMGGGMEP